MPRNMSFAMTTDQMRARTKTVTRRFGWWFLKPGELVNAVERTMGLKRGEKVVAICPIEIVGTRSEPLNAITRADCILEGFPDLPPERFVAMLVAHYRCDPAKPVNRIEFKYLD